MSTAPIVWVEEPSAAMLAARLRLSRAALERNPDSVELRLAHGLALVRCGDPGTALDHLRAAVERFPEAPAPRVALAGLLVERGEFEAALAALAAPACRGSGRGAALELRLRMRLEQWEAAHELAPIVERLALTDPVMTEYYARTLPDAPEALLRACDHILSVKPGHADALHHRAMALIRLGRLQEARDTLGLDRLVSIGELHVEGGPAFHTRLRAEILANDTLRPDPRGKSTRLGRQTDILVRPGDTATPALCDALRTAVQIHSEGLEGDLGFIRGKPGRARLKAWAVVYSDGGTQDPHRHPSAWLSGVFYVGGTEKQAGGALLLGVEDGLGPILRVEPVPGRLVLFPSAAMHATDAAGQGGERISVAFDVIDAG